MKIINYLRKLLKNDNLNDWKFISLIYILKVWKYFLFIVLLVVLYLMFKDYTV